MPVALAKVLCPSSEFVRWQVWFAEQEARHPTLDHQYLAQIAAEVQRGWMPPELKGRVRDSDFMLVAVGDQSPATQVTEASAALVPVVTGDRLANSKACWGALMAASMAAKQGGER